MEDFNFLHESFESKMKGPFPPRNFTGKILISLRNQSLLKSLKDYLSTFFRVPIQGLFGPLSPLGKEVGPLCIITEDVPAKPNNGSWLIEELVSKKVPCLGLLLEEKGNPLGNPPTGENIHRISLEKGDFSQVVQIIFDFFHKHAGAEATPRPIPTAGINLPQAGINLRVTINEIESSLILQALIMTKGNKNKASKLLQLNRTTLIEKMKKKGLDPSLV